MSTRPFKLARRAAVAGVLVALVATAPALAKKRPAADYTPTLAPPPAAAPVANGAIYQASSGYSALYEGTRARRVGDMITILLVEQTVAQKVAGSTTARQGGIGLTPPKVGPLSFVPDGSLQASGDQKFNGKGTAEQSNKLQGEVSVTVADVLPNGIMRVRGQKQVTLNRGDEYIQISGLIRPADVDAYNRVLSTRVADARITYTGKGDVQRASRQGWLQRFFSAVSPF
ncbi:flagellar basal body L-ring protein FlgH [Sphingomonas flavalba]|uniref:flagellar basal body L-ring protein FlgH n=1 Tax=Sphingomonas flavalba TaxID=2559804 RepID=UPI0039E00DE7